MTSFSAEQPVAVPMLTAWWLSQTFVHWPYPPEEIQALLPGGLQVDVFRNTAWVSMTPFLMASVRTFGMVPVPGRTFPETNVRTYVRLPDGRDGVWFLSLEVGSPLMLAARVIGAPYHLASLKLRKDGPVLHYTGERRGGGAGYRLTVRPGAAIDMSEHDVWLVSRWRAFTRSAGTLWETPVEHEPWPLARATLVDLRETLTARAGLSAPAGGPVVHYSPGIGPVRLRATRPAQVAAAMGVRRQRKSASPPLRHP
ncbi:YqjF family protein [Streptomyces sp. SYSU K217416]